LELRHAEFSPQLAIGIQGPGDPRGHIANNLESAELKGGGAVAENLSESAFARENGKDLFSFDVVIMKLRLSRPTHAAAEKKAALEKQSIEGLTKLRLLHGL
jgi:hypothetical protein